MRVAIAGAGNVGLFIANDLVSAGHEVQVIEQSPEVGVRRERRAGHGGDDAASEPAERQSGERLPERIRGRGDER